MDRRRFLSTIGAGLAGGRAARAVEASAVPRTRSDANLGRTGLRVSDISS